MLNITLRISTLLLFAIQYVYWKITERKADKAKPKSPPTFVQQIRHKLWTILTAFVTLQIVGLHVFLYPYNPLMQLTGTILVLCGILVGIMARREIGVNWTHAFEYQIKKNHDLVTSGIYYYVRHPIYTGILVSFVGAELVAGSYLVFIIAFIIFLGVYKQAKAEEKILTTHFGKPYIDYMNKTKMLIPYIL